jgi:hypothetical protein
MIKVTTTKLTEPFVMVTSLEGDFELHLSPVLFDALTFTPKRKISFQFNPEISQDLAILLKQTKEEVAELVAEKLKQDFKSAMLNDTFIRDDKP